MPDERALSTASVNQAKLLLSISTAVLLLAVSFYFERIAYSYFLPEARLAGYELAVVLALAFTLAKAALVLAAVPAASKLTGMVVASRAGLVILSAIGSLVVVAPGLSNPKLDEALVQRRAEVADPFRAELSLLDAQEAEAMLLLQERIESARQSELAPQLEKVEAARAGMDKERYITNSSGEFKGRRYLSHQANESDALTAIATIQDRFNERAASEIDRLQTRFAEQRQRVRDRMQQAIDAVQREDFDGTAAAQHPAVLGVLGAVNRVFHWFGVRSHPVQPLDLATVVAILMSCLIEALPILLLIYSRLLIDELTRPPKRRLAPPVVPPFRRNLQGGHRSTRHRKSHERTVGTGDS